MQGGAQGRSAVDVARALRDAGVTALIAFGLFLPLIGFQTVTDIRNELILATRWPLLFAIVAIVGVGRLAYSLVLRAVARAARAAAGRSRAVGLARASSANGSRRSRSASSSPIR